MVKRLLIILFELGVGCIILLTCAFFWLSHYIDTEEFRVALADGFQAVIGRPVELGGELDIDIWPGFNLAIENLTIAGDPEFSSEPFAHCDRIVVHVDLIPLLAERLDVSSVVVEKMELNLIQKDDGRSNWQFIVDASEKETVSISSLPGGYSFQKIELRGLEVVNASIRFQPGADASAYRLDGINLKTGSISPGRDVPFSIKSSFSWAKGSIESDIILKGMFETWLDGDGIALKDATLYASVGGDFLPEGANPGEFTARIVMDWDKRTIGLDGVRARFLGLRAEGDFETGDLSKSLSADGHLTVQPFVPAEVISRYWPSRPVSSVKGLKNGAFTSFFHVDESGVEFKDLAVALDDITVRGRLGIQGYSKPVFSFGLRGNSIDLDRYLPLFMTDTPFVWDDFGLAFFRKFRGQGAVRADGLKIADTLISDIRLSIKGDGKSILIDAGATKEGLASLGGKTEIAIGRNEADGSPTLGMSAQLTAQSQEDGFTLLRGEQWQAGGQGTVKVEVTVKPMVCVPSARSINILRFLETKGTLSLGPGESRFTGEDGQPFVVDYSKAVLNFEAYPGVGDQDGQYDFTVLGDIKTEGGSEIKNMSVAIAGPVSTAVDRLYVKSPGLEVKGHFIGGPLPEKSGKMVAGGTVAFDTDSRHVSIAKGAVNVLGSRLRGSVDIPDWDKPKRATGRFEVVQANPRRIIYLLSGISLETEDPEALKKAGLAAQYEMDENGFTVSDLTGNLDGMEFKGHVVGNGLVDPMLSFSLWAGAFNLDRYLPPSRKLTPEERRSGKVAKAPPVDMPLKFLRALRLNGKAHFEEFILAKVRAQSVYGDIKADKGNIYVSRVKGVVHGGTLAADWKGKVGEKALTTDIVMHIEDMQAGPLMLEMAKREYLQGVTDADFDLKSGGATDDEILANLQGKVAVRISNGSFKFTGYNVKAAPQKAGSDFDINKSRPKGNRRTSFQKAVGQFTVKDGVFVADKFRMEAPPLLQSYGRGHFSLPANSIDFSIRNDFVVVPSVTIQLVGRLTDPEVRVPTGKILNNTVRNILSLPEKSFNFLRDLFQ